jgi:hypothetical protein
MNVSVVLWAMLGFAGVTAIENSVIVGGVLVVELELPPLQPTMSARTITG